MRLTAASHICAALEPSFSRTPHAVGPHLSRGFVPSRADASRGSIEKSVNRGFARSPKPRFSSECRGFKQLGRNTQAVNPASIHFMPYSTCLTLKRPGLCGWLRPTQIKPWLDWVGSAAQVRHYCVDSAAQAFNPTLAGCVPCNLQYALCGPRNSRSAYFTAHALDVLATHESPYPTQLCT